MKRECSRRQSPESSSASLDVPHKEQVEEFKGDLASIAISAVFILLAASLKPGDLAALDWRDASVVALLMFVVRPIRVFLSTWGSELRRNEKAFISLLGPRGIVAASVATFFALELTDAGHAEGRWLVSLVFAVVLASVLIEGSAAGLLAKLFKVMPKHTIIVGADETARLLATELSASGETVSLIDTDKVTMLTRGRFTRREGFLRRRDRPLCAQACGGRECQVSRRGDSER